MRLEGIVRKVVTFAWDRHYSGGIPSLAPKKKTHGALALLLIAGSVSMICLVRLSTGQGAVAGAKCRTRLPEIGG